MNVCVPSGRAVDLFHWQDTLAADLSRVPTLIQTLLDDLVPSSGPRTQQRVSGSTDRHSTPIRIDLLDEVDELWAVLWELIDQLAERNNEEPPDIRKRQHFAIAAGVRVVRGFNTSSRTQIAESTEMAIQWLLRRSAALTLEPCYGDAVEDLQQRLSRLFSIAGLNRWNIYHRLPCDLCGHRTVLPEWRPDATDPKRWVCEHCEHIQPW